jgi:hypothetical protein
MQEFTVFHQVLTRYSTIGGNRFPNDYDHYQLLSPQGNVIHSGDGDEGKAECEAKADGYNAALFRKALKEAETERKTQDLLIAELTEKVVSLSDYIAEAKPEILAYREIGKYIAGKTPIKSYGRSTETLVMEYIDRLERGLEALKANINSQSATIERLLLPEKPLIDARIKIFKGDSILVAGYVIRMKGRGYGENEFLACSDWMKENANAETILVWRKAYLDYVEANGAPEFHPYSGEIITPENRERIEAELKKLALDE